MDKNNEIEKSNEFIRDVLVKIICIILLGIVSYAYLIIANPAPKQNKVHRINPG